VSSEAQYQSIYEKYIGTLLRGEVRVDETLSHLENDRRLGISVIVPMHQLGDRYERFAKIAASVEPDLYLYPLEDLHITVFDLIQGSESYRRDNAKDVLFSEIVNNVARVIEPFSIEFKGVVFSDEAGMLQGFDNDRLVGIRQKIRTILGERGITNDERYESQSAHITFCRFQKKVKNKEAFLTFLDEYRHFEFGSETVTHLEIVEHDWYNLKSKKRTIQNIPLYDRIV
jgi:2'-5' RNA ligase